MGNSSHHESDHGHDGHFIMPDAMAYKVGGALLVLTVITVAVAQVNLGPFNFLVAMIVATIKAALVCMFFMGLKFDRRENMLIFFSSLIFCAIFFILTMFDLFYRGDVYPKKGVAFFAEAKGSSKFSKPWNTNPQIVEHGKELFSVQCASCHGTGGRGDGPAAAALNPKPRDFTAAVGWKNGRKPSQIFGTLTKGLGGMPAFGSLPAEDRWALAHYVATLGPDIDSDSEADLRKAGIDPNQEGAGSSLEKTIPVDLAIEILHDENS